MSTVKKLTVARLKQLINEEKKKMKSQGLLGSDTVEDAWSGGENLVNQIDFVKKLGIKEAKLMRDARNIARVRKALKKKIVEDI